MRGDSIFILSMIVALWIYADLGMAHAQGQWPFRRSRRER